MFVYEKKLQYPVRITTPNPKLAKAIITQYGGPYRKRTLVFRTQPIPWKYQSRMEKEQKTFPFTASTEM